MSSNKIFSFFVNLHALCHERRNVAEYEGYLEIDNQLLSDLLVAAQTLLSHINSIKKSL